MSGQDYETSPDATQVTREAVRSFKGFNSSRAEASTFARATASRGRTDPDWPTGADRAVEARA